MFQQAFPKTIMKYLICIRMQMTCMPFLCVCMQSWSVFATANLVSFAIKAFNNLIWNPGEIDQKIILGWTNLVPVQSKFFAFCCKCQDFVALFILIVP